MYREAKDGSVGPALDDDCVGCGCAYTGLNVDRKAEAPEYRPRDDCAIRQRPVEIPRGREGVTRGGEGPRIGEGARAGDGVRWTSDFRFCDCVALAELSSAWRTSSYG